MRTWSLSVHADKGVRSLALVAPHGTFPVARVTEDVQRVIDALPLGTELDCVGEGNNISGLVVDRVTGPVHVLGPVVAELPDAWVHAVGALALARARLRLDRGEDARADLEAAMRARIPGLAADFARLPAGAREALAGAYADWSRAQPVTPELLASLAIARWSEGQARGALEWALARDGTFGDHEAAAIAARLEEAGGDPKPFAKKLAKLAKKGTAKKGDAAAPTTCVRIDASLPKPKVIGGTNETIYVASTEPSTTGEWRGARFVRDADTPVLAAFGLDGRERTDLRRRGRAVSDVAGEVLESKRIDRYGAEDESDAAVTVASQSGEETLPRPPWSFGYWAHASSLGVDMHWKGKSLFVRPTNGPWVALTLAKAPAAVDLAPPWLALHGDAGIVAVRIDALLGAQAITLDGEKIVARAKKVERPKLPKRLAEWFGVLVEQGLVAPLDDPERDQLLFSKLEDATKPGRDALGRVLEDHTPLVVSHDSHWFEPSDRIVARFAAALEGEPVRFTEDALAEGSITVGVHGPKGARSFTCEPLVYEVAAALDAELEKEKASKRIYTLDSYQEDIHLYIVLTPAHRKRLLAAGITGIGADASPHDT